MLKPSAKDQIKHMVDRFLGWKLPESFNPDDGISFEPIAGKDGPYPFRRRPTGTNLFSADQAEEMVRYMLEEMPNDAPAVKLEPEKWGRPYLEREYKKLWGVLRRTQAALELVTCRSDAETHRGDIAHCRKMLDEIEAALKPIEYGRHR
jgi:hypothetical protein